MIRKIALVGLGTMGPGIAARLARGGITVSAYDISEAAITRTHALLTVARDILDRLGIEAPAGRDGEVHLVDSLDACVMGADLVIENIPEDVELKADFYRKLDPIIGSCVIVATNTSGIPITKLQTHISNPGRFVGIHWSNPPHIIPMVEVIGGNETTSETVSTARNLIRSLGLLPVVVKKDIPGFVENRILYALLREAIDLVERGVIDPEDIDTCVSWGVGFKIAVIGPMALLDLAGLDIYRSVSSFLNSELSNRTDVAPVIEQKIASAHLGIKSGHGIYSYTPETIAKIQAERASKLIAIRRILEGRK